MIPNGSKEYEAKEPEIIFEEIEKDKYQKEKIS